MIWQRLKNLWEISAYRVGRPSEVGKAINFDNVIVKNVTTVKKKMATVIPERSQLEESIIDEGGDII